MSRAFQLDADARRRVLARIAAALADRADLSFALVFGSFVESDVFRDLDLAVWTTSQSSPDLDLTLAAALSTDLGIPVDVRRINDAPMPFLFHALRGTVVASRDDELLAKTMERVARDYHDIAPRLRQAAREVFAR